MRGRGKLLATTMAGVVISVLASPVVPAAASGGGGCGRPVMDASGTTMRIRNYCFGPTILRAPVGADVRFVNRDSTPHTVLGANASWGSFRDLRKGDEVTYRFSRAGVYPFVCTYHPGMVGAIVVGDAGAPMIATNGGGGAVTRIPASEAMTVPAAVPAPVPSATIADGDGGVAPWATAGLVVVALIAAGALLRGGGRRRSIASPSGEGGPAS